MHGLKNVVEVKIFHLNYYFFYIINAKGSE